MLGPMLNPGPNMHDACMHLEQATKVRRCHTRARPEKHTLTNPLPRTRGASTQQKKRSADREASRAGDTFDRKKMGRRGVGYGGGGVVVCRHIDFFGVIF